MSTDAIEKAVSKLRHLPDDRQMLAVGYIESLSAGTTLPAAGNGLKAFAGCIPKQDADLMERAIEEAFEQIHPDEWKDLPRQ